ncbi:PE family protein, partial [Mycobacterium riyadhense]
MSYVIAASEAIAAAAEQLTGIGSAIEAAGTAVATSTTQLLPAAGDEVSAAIAALFGTFGQDFQSVQAQAVSFHARFVQALNTGAGTYAAAEAANVLPLAAAGQGQDLLAAVAHFHPVQDLTGRPLFGNGADGAPGTGQAGGDGGWLIGNGGNGGSGGNGANGGAGGA